MWRYDGSGWHFYDSSNTILPGGRIYVLEASDKYGFLFDCDSAVGRYDNDSFQIYTYQEMGLEPEGISAIYCDSLDHIWVASGYPSVIAHYDGLKWEVLDTSLYKFPGIIYSIFGAEDDLWLGTNNDGLVHLTSSGWQLYDRGNSNIPSDYVSSIASAPSGELWLGFSYELISPSTGYSVGGLAKFNGTDFEAVNPFNRWQTWVTVNGIEFDQAGNMYVATRCEGIWMHDGGIWEQVAGLPDTGCAYGIDGIFVDRHNQLWYGDLNTGLWKSEPLPLKMDSITRQTFQIYPNPASGNLNWRSEGAVQCIEVYNMLGLLMLHEEGNLEKVGTTSMVDLAPSQYLVVFRTEIGVRIQRLIIQ